MKQKLLCPEVGMVQNCFTVYAVDAFSDQDSSIT